MMRTLRDMNMSKFVAEDVPLFLSLVDDLFPGQKAERSQFPEVQAALEKVRWPGLPGRWSHRQLGLEVCRSQRCCLRPCPHRLPRSFSTRPRRPLLRRWWRSAACRRTRPG